MSKLDVNISNYKMSDTPSKQHNFWTNLELVCNYFNVSQDDLLSSKRDKKFVYSRYCLVALVFTVDSDFGLRELGGMLHRDHSTIIHSRTMFFDLIAHDEKFVSDWRYLRNNAEKIFGKPLHSLPPKELTPESKDLRRNISEKETADIKVQKMIDKAQTIREFKMMQMDLVPTVSPHPIDAKPEIPIVMYNHSLNTRKEEKNAWSNRNDYTNMFVGNYPMKKIIN